MSLCQVGDFTKINDVKNETTSLRIATYKHLGFILILFSRIFISNLLFYLHRNYHFGDKLLKTRFK